MNEAEKFDIKSLFYIKTGPKSNRDARTYINDKDFVLILKNIIERGHTIGLHPSYCSYENFEYIKKEKEILEEISGCVVKETRQHYLRFDIPNTWRILDRLGVETDSSMGYAEHEGFRCGTANEFPVFDVLNGVKLNIKERPLLVMEGTLRDYRKLSNNKAEEVFIYYKNICKLFDMPYTVLFHRDIYFNVLKRPV